MQNSQNSLLKKMTFVTSFGDYFTLFALILITQQYFHDVTISAYCAVVKSAAIAFAGVFIPKILPGFKSKSIFVYSQLASSFLLFALWYLLKNKHLDSPALIFFVIFVNTFLWQVFVAARESLSKALTKSDDDHRSNTAELLSGLLMAQTLGPLVALATIYAVGPLAAIFVDAATFLVCAFMGLRIHTFTEIEKGASFLRPFTYFSKKPLLRRIFLLRSLGYWVPTAIFNFLIFAFAAEKFSDFLSPNNSILGSAVIYAVCGFGAWLGNTFIRQKRLNLKNVEDGALAFYSQVLIGAMFLLFLVPTLNVYAICGLYFLQALGMGGNALATQTIRRKLTTNTEFAEIVSLEVVFGRALDWVIGTFTALAIKYFGVNTNILLVFAALWFFVAASMHLKFDRKQYQ